MEKYVYMDMWIYGILGIWIFGIWECVFKKIQEKIKRKEEIRINVYRLTYIVCSGLFTDIGLWGGIMDYGILVGDIV